MGCYAHEYGNPDPEHVKPLDFFREGLLRQAWEGRGDLVRGVQSWIRSIAV